ncbi:MAG: arginine repressor [Alphaproteobacteria bacterium]|nr:MAG: arginine repressor [Alphaproteobacteria bacterium]
MEPDDEGHAKLLPGTGRGTSRRLVEGSHASMLAALAPLHRRSGGPPPRAGEEQEMTDARIRRQKLIADLIRAEAVGSQEELTARLAAQGLTVNQATVSRDLDQLGAVKVKRGGALAYALPDQLGDSDWAASRLERILGEWVLSVEAAGNLLILKTPPGSAHLVGLALDQAQLPEIAGTICGDDTLFLALRDGVVAGALAERFRKLSEG